MDDMHVTATHNRLHSPQWRRRALEAAGWRTWLSYEENHVRDGDGRMVAVDERWMVELEHIDGTAVTVSAPSVSAAWSAAWERVTRPSATDRARRAPTRAAQ